MCSQSHRSSQQGFTLLEMVVVLALIIVSFSAVAFIISDEGKEDEVVAIAEQIESLFYQCKKASIVNRIDYTIQLKGKTFAMFQRSAATPTQTYKVPDPFDVQYNQPLSNGTQWLKAEDERFGEFFFGKSGLNAPFSVRIFNSESSCEITFDPVTGNPTRTVIFN